MKTKLYITLLAACVAGLSSCESDIDNYMVDDTIGLLNPGLVEAEVYAGLDDPYKVFAVKAGKGFQGADVTIAVDSEVLNEYNVKAEKELNELPANCYTISVSKLHLDNADYRLPFEIRWDREALKAALDTDANVGIPLRMTVVGETGVTVDQKRLTCIIKPTLEVPMIQLDKTGVQTGLMPTRRTAEEEDIYMTVSSNFIAQQDIDYTLEVDPTLLEGTEYTLLPEDAYRIDLTGWTLKKYMNSSRFKFTFVRSAIIPDDGHTLFGEYALPLRLKTVSSSNINDAKCSVIYRVSVVADKIDKSLWTIYSCNSNIADDPDEAVAGGNYGPENLIDDQTSTAWRSVWSTVQPLPYEIVIDMGVKRDLYKVGYQNPTGSNKQYINSKAGYVEVSDDAENWERIANWTAPSKNSASVEFEVLPSSGQYLKFVITEAFTASRPRTSIAEINAWGE